MIIEVKKPYERVGGYDTISANTDAGKDNIQLAIYKGENI
jgi:hypothetical protein